MSATSAFLISVIAGVLGNRSDDLLYKSQNVVKRMFNNVQEPTNQEIQCAVRRAYLKATLLTCKSLKKNKYGSHILTPKYLSDISSHFRQQIKKLDKDKTFVPPSDFDSNFETLLQSKGVSAKDRLPELILTLKQSILHSLEVPPFKVEEELKKYILEGWEENGKHVDWYELMCAFFQEELKNNSRLSTIIQTNLLTHINQNINEVQISFHAFNQRLESFWSDYKNILPILDEINQKLGEQSEKLEQNSTILQEIKTRLDNIQLGQVIYTNPETFQNANLDNQIFKLAKQKYDEGKFKEARSLLEQEQITNGLDVLLERNQKVQQNLKDKAEELLLLAQLTAVNYDLGEKRYEAAEIHFEQSLKAHRNIDNIFGFALFLQQNNQIPKAEPLYREVLQLKRRLAQANPQDHIVSIAHILNNLGILYEDKNDYLRAKQAFKDALMTYRTLARLNSKIYLPYVAMVLNNLGSLYGKNEFEQAKQAHLEALDVYQKLAESNPQIYRPYIAMVLNNLANAYSNNNESEQALQAYQKALGIRRELVKTNPKEYLSDLAITLSCLAALHIAPNRFEKAEEALDIYRKLVESNPQTYLPEVAYVLNTLGALQEEKYKLKQAEESFKQAVDIRQKLANLYPQIYLPRLAETMINLSTLYCHDNYSQKEKAVELAIRVIKIAKHFQHIPIVIEYKDSAYEVLKKWDIDIESIFDEGDENSK